MESNPETACEGIGYRSLTMSAPAEFNGTCNVLNSRHYTIDRDGSTLCGYPFVYKVYSTDYQAIKNDLFFCFLHNEVAHAIALNDKAYATLLFVVSEEAHVQAIRKVVSMLRRTHLDELLKICWVGYTYSPPELVVPWLLLQRDPFTAQRGCVDIEAVPPYACDGDKPYSLRSTYNAIGVQTLLNYVDEVNL